VLNIEFIVERPGFVPPIPGGAGFLQGVETFPATLASFLQGVETFPATLAGFLQGVETFPATLAGFLHPVEHQISS
jgi:hypothetical protein